MGPSGARHPFALPRAPGPAARTPATPDLMSARAVRRVVLVVCVLGIAGMIVSSIGGHNGAAVTFGLITAAAVLCSMVATAVAAGGGPLASEPLGEELEARIARLVAAGADEVEVRALVGESVRFGRSTARGGQSA